MYSTGRVQTASESESGSGVWGHWFLWTESFYTLPSVRNVLAGSGKSGVLAGIGPLPTSWPFMVDLRTVMVPVRVPFSMLVYYNEHVMRLKVYWK